MNAVYCTSTCIALYRVNTRVPCTITCPKELKNGVICDAIEREFTFDYYYTTKVTRFFLFTTTLLEMQMIKIEFHSINLLKVG